jgi:polyhydroxyalkanoate synthesis repressor PhaR
MRMPLIKRYPNRKLYDTDAKQYITLDGIASLIRRGEEVQVIDYSSGEDLTTLTLTQIILEEEKRKAGFLPRNVLSGLVKAGGETVGNLQRALASSLGWWAQFDDEMQRRLDVLVSQGDISAKEARRMLSKLKAALPADPGDTIPPDAEEAAEAVLRERGIPTRRDVNQIAAQLDLLEEKIAALEKRPKATGSQEKVNREDKGT